MARDLAPIISRPDHAFPHRIQNQAEPARLLRDQGAAADAVITRLWRASDKGRQPRVAYQFSAAGRTYQGESPAKLSVWKTLETGSTLAVRYLAARPEVNHPRDWPEKPAPFWLAYLVGGAMAAMAAPATWPLRMQRRLLSEGRAAPGIVTRHARGEHGTTLHYDFLELSGATVHGRCGPVSKPAPVARLSAYFTIPRTRGGARCIRCRWWTLAGSTRKI